MASALGTYLVKLSTSMEIEKAASSLNPADPRLARHASKDDKPSAWYTSRDSDARGSSNARARLHLLNLLDLLFLTTNDTANLATVTSELEPPLVELIRLAAPVSGKQALDIHRALRKLLTHLETFYSRSEMLRIRSPARTAYGEWLDWLQKLTPTRTNPC
ncbi:hypothetical protein H2203_001918 [Taxawa tesnikishii (nom. ined.)]|nr:hypothetical protein H2203_001918 [Dothideales sp. JES 119]